MKEYTLKNIYQWKYAKDYPQTMAPDATVDIIAHGLELEVTDGYHTMDELYRHRYALFIALCRIYDNYITPLGSRVKCWKSKLHHDGTMFDDSFILGMTVSGFKESQQISYHLPIHLWRDINVLEMEKAPEWDGHTSEDVIHRLLKL